MCFTLIKKKNFRKICFNLKWRHWNSKFTYSLSQLVFTMTVSALSFFADKTFHATDILILKITPYWSGMRHDYCYNHMYNPEWYSRAELEWEAPHCSPHINACKRIVNLKANNEVMEVASERGANVVWVYSFIVVDKNRKNNFSAWNERNGSVDVVQ